MHMEGPGPGEGGWTEEEASPGHSRLRWNEITSLSLGHIWQNSVSSPDGPNQLTATRHDSRHLALKPIQACRPAWGWAPGGTPAAGRPDVKGLQCELCNIKKKFF